MLSYLITPLVAAMLTLAVAFGDSVTLGSLIAVAVVAVIVGVFQAREKIGASWRDEASAQKERAERLQEEKDALVAQMHSVELDVASLKARPDMTTLHEEITRLAQTATRAGQQVAERLTAHDERSVAAIKEHTGVLRSMQDDMHNLMREHWKLLGLVAASGTGAASAQPMARRILHDHDEET